jgi:MFS family permease
MTSLVKVGTGTGMFIVPSVASLLILGFGWRTAWAVLAVAGAVWTISISQFLRRDPRQMDLEPYGTAAANHASPAATETGLTLGEVMRTRQFWTICGAYFIIWYSTQSVMLHIAAHGVDTGLSLTQAAGTVSIIGAASIAGRLTMGVTGDRVGNRRALVYCFSVLVVALVWLQFAEGLWMLWLFALIYGFAHGGFFAIVSPLVAELFGTKAHGANLGIVLFVGQTGGALGPIVTGRIFDVNHNYSLAFLILAIATAAGLIVASLLRPVGNKKI